GEGIWLEIPCADPTRAFAFYHAVFGWEVPSDMPPTMDTHASGVDSVHPFIKGNLRGHFGKMSGGINDIVQMGETPGFAKQGPVLEIVTEDIDATTAKVVENGGRVHVPKYGLYGGKLGYIARYIDTEGNMVGAWSAPVV
ncbi:hypothetical protein B0T16DRAFT_337167, partial [Cercophora newfieldiana]